MARKKPAHHLLDVYDAHLWLAWNDPQWDKLRAKFDGGGLEEADRDAVATTSLIVDTHHGNQPHLVVWIGLDQHGDNPLGLVTSAAHEAAHVANILLSHVGHEIRQYDEPHAYLVGWVTRWIVEQIEWKL